MITVALFGAAGKMGTRLWEKLRAAPEYRLLCVEAGEAGLAALRARGISPASAEEAAREADIVILAIPDRFIGRVAGQIVPLLKAGAMVVCLDPAAPYNGELPDRADIAYFVTHPCHPPLVKEEETPEARADFFGGVAKQSVVCALMQGTEEDYRRGEALCRTMFAPILRVHRITVEQMAILEPAMSESVTLTLVMAIREALDEAIARGVPAEAARDFMLGHLGVNVGILFGFIEAEVSDGAKMAAERGKAQILQPGWKKVFERENILAEVRAITGGAKERGR